MIKEVLKKVHCLEEFWVECAEMCHLPAGIGKHLMNKNEAYLKSKEDKEADKQKALLDLTQCEMFRYLGAT